jgi:hypothetical protein
MCDGEVIILSFRNKIVKIRYVLYTYIIKIDSRCRLLGGEGGTDIVVYISRRNDEIGSIKIYRYFNLRQVSAIYHEIHFLIHFF